MHRAHHLRHCLVLFLLFSVADPSAIAQDNPPDGLTPAVAQTLVERFLASETVSYPGKVSYSIGNIGNAKLLGQCRRAEAGFTPGARLYGRTQVSLRCLDGARWQFSVPVSIRVQALAIASRQGLANGQVLTEADLTTQQADLGELPAGVLTDASLAVGRVARMAIPAGKVLRSDMLKTRSLISVGQTVKISTHGPGFEVSNEGVALNSAGLGELVKAKLANGQLVSGKATSDGRIEIAF